MSDTNTFGLRVNDVPREKISSSRLEQITDRGKLRKAIIDDLAEMARMAKLFLSSRGTINCHAEACAILQSLDAYVARPNVQYPEGAAPFLESTRKALPVIMEGIEMVFKHGNPDGVDQMLNAYDYG